MADDPLSLVHDAMWSMLEDADFSNKVLVGNRLKFSKAAGNYRDPTKLVSLSTGRPTVGILDMGAQIRQEVTSSACLITSRYSIVVVTGDLRLDVEYYPVVWSVICAVLGWWDHLRTLVWPSVGGRQFVHLAHLTDLASSFVDAGENRGIRGWVGRLTYEVEMNFQTSSIKP